MDYHNKEATAVSRFLSLTGYAHLTPPRRRHCRHDVIEIPPSLPLVREEVNHKLGNKLFAKALAKIAVVFAKNYNKSVP